MATILGKVAAFLTVSLAIMGVGLALWVTIDRRDWKKQVDDINKEIDARYTKLDQEQKALQELVRELSVGQRRLAWEFKLKGEKLDLPLYITVAMAKQELAKAREQNRQLQDQLSTMQVQNQTLLGQNRQQRVRTEEALAEQRRLREEIEQPKIEGKPSKPFRENIADARNDKEAAERSQEELRPHLVNALIAEANLIKRGEELVRRIEQLKKE
jgi:hypothetical protein